MTDSLELDGKNYVPAETVPIPEWPCVRKESRIPTLTLKDDDIFLLTDTLGNISSCLPEESTSIGLFCQDTRFLSRLELQIENQLPILLSSNARRGFALSILCANPYFEEKQIGAETIGIEREIVINGGLFEKLTINNYRTSPVDFELSISFDADFLDLFEIRGWQRKERGKLLRPTAQGNHNEVETELQDLLLNQNQSEQSQPVGAIPSFEEQQSSQETTSRNSSRTSEDLVLAYQGLDGVVMESRIRFSSHQPDSFKGNTAIWHIQLDSHETVSLCYRVQLRSSGIPISRVGTPMTLKQAKSAESMELQEWQQQVTTIRSDSNTFNRLIERAEQDVYMLRQSFQDRKVLVAGIPWFSTLFGRDSIIAAWQTLILDPNIAKDTLFLLAQYQGKKEEPTKEEEPGKILHELRFGEMARCGEIPHTPYYGTVDATPLWLILYAQYYAWTGDRETLEHLWEEALSAMGWIDRNCQATGYISYNSNSLDSLLNQGWKDSSDCIVDGQGHLAQGAITLCEAQSYVYEAKIHLSAIARIMKRNDLADRWYREAQELKNRFNRDFWLPKLDYCALALDGEGNPVDSITSNPGHCLSSGILHPEKAMNIAERLRAPDMFSGWGIRTLSSLSPAYNPMGYHIGSVWPHDNSMIAFGLRTLARELPERATDLIDQTLEIATGIIDMTFQQPYVRPPELFCGYDRIEDNPPVRSGNTTACRVAKKRGNLKVVIEA